MPDDLIAPASRIIDLPALRDALFAACAEATTEAEVRAIAVKMLSAARKDGREVIAGAFNEKPRAAFATTEAYAWLTDCIVRLVFDLATQRLHPLNNPTEGERLTLMAVGGYGRGEMAPYSDVDLLFLTPWKITPWAESVIESMLYILWDLKLKVGHASRTVKDCLRLGGEDYTIRTALLETRYITGHEPLARELENRLWEDLFKGSERAFVAAKLEERDQRHRKQGLRYVVEPNIKEGKGGLRDLQSLYWITKYIHHTDDAEQLVPLGVFRREEYDTFIRAEEFLWAARCHLHLAAGRAVEQLTFDMQVEVAERMGYVDRGGRRAVEWFMQDYFRHATAVGDLTRIFLTSLEAEHRKDAPLLVRMLKRGPKVKPGYEVVHNRLAIVDETAFLSDKVNLLRFFEEGLRTGLLLHPDAMRLVKANLHLIDDELRTNREARRIFMDLLLKHGNPERSLRRMNELGVLGAFIPEFETIVAMMQFNMYHSYTVDEHTIQCIRHLSDIEHGDLVEELPVASTILKEGVNRKVIYVALLLHDIGKGRDEDHSVLGARIARKVAPRLGLNKSETATVEWLVRYHLLMSDMAQKRDIADPRTVRDFAKAVQTKERLDLLTVLTVCDIRGVGPNVWNNWKAALLRALYRQTRRALEDGMEALNRENRGAEAKKALREALSDWEPRELRAETQRHYPPYWQGLHVTAHAVFAELLRDIRDDEIRIDIHPDEDRDATRVCFALSDHPGIFARLAGALSLVGANVVDARTFTSKDGYATAAFWIQDGDGSPYEESRLPRLRDTIRKTLLGEVKPREAILSRGKLKKREKAFNVPTSVTFDNEGSEIYTIIEVDTRDRPGLLYDLARTLSESNVYIASAVIATYGEQVVDTFYVKDMFGLKFYTPSKQKTLERRLRAAIEAGTERIAQND
ncbi:MULTISPECIES: [protein-PII] uridylyltransferase [Salipiger]|jgi:[protein-PII] uridylyltransferase|uniref:Bifunctional uridylyltransferase/uridylyl-removing enzyme n=1 Tax=Salipiger profundus TaxID=1229727 RepID=A0A1U7D558_9RHOB|nr:MULTISPECIES: [protein-PII] uridylyltransferase [Salipiger]APX23253.1 UTP--GlnB (protein PII) uridylyltransferase, GlnD [Salipiger profundus]GGA14290.1 bifunctional uridylyltransferase/uridylyl-removing enzyme [Salipiger profundus]SFD49169.1 UTP--GlnB (protein PII) uridylyltransferase, GlnD [Salipiger profundus]